MKKEFALALFATVASASSAMAGHKKIYSPVVEKGELAMEAEYSYGQSNFFSQSYGVEYGVNDYWMTEVAVEIERESGDKTRVHGFRWENIITPFTAGEMWADVGFYFEIEKAAESDQHNTLETKLLLQKSLPNKLLTTANLKLEHEFGPNHEDGLEGGLALQLKYRENKSFEPAIEYYASYGHFRDLHGYDEQKHLVGPVVQGKIGHVKYDTGVLFGISEAAEDALFKLNLEYEF